MEAPRRKQVPVMENMEPRLLLNGTVIASVSGSLLSIVGDNRDNAISISQDNGAIVVDSADGGDTTVITRGNMANVNRIAIKMKAGDDTVVILSTVDISGKLAYDGGRGDNEFFTAAAVSAEGSIELSGNYGQAASGSVWFDNDVETTDAAAARGSVTFDEVGPVAASGTLTITSIAATAATGSIDTAVAGAFATGAVRFGIDIGLYQAGATITLDDGANPAIVFTAVAGAPADATEFTIGADVATTLDNFVAAVNDAANTLAITAVANANDIDADLTNDAVGTDGNQDIALNALAVTAGISDTDMTGGADAMQIGDTIVIGDGTHSAITFTAAAAEAGTSFELTAGDDAATLDSLFNVINAAEAAVPDVFTVQATQVGAPTTSLDLDNLVGGSDGNVDIVTTGGAWANVLGMSGGIDAFTAGDSVTLNDGFNAVVTFVAFAPGADPAPAVGAPEFSIVAGDAVTTMQNLVAAINGYNETTLEISALYGDPVAGKINLTNTSADLEASNGNQLILTSGARWTDTEMTGGADAFSGKDGDTISLSDGTTAVIFTLKDSPTGNNQVGIGLTAAETAVNFAAAVNAYPALEISAWLTAGSQTVDLLNNIQGADGNVDIVVTFADPLVQLIDATGMSGGQDEGTTTTINLFAGDNVQIYDGVNETVTFVAILGTATAGSAEFTIGATAEATAVNFAAAVNGYTESTLALAATADGDGVDLVNDQIGENGNNGTLAASDGDGNPFPWWLDQRIETSGFGGGQDPSVIAAGATIVLNDGTNPAVTFTAVAGAPTGTQFQLGATVADTTANLLAAINAAANLDITATADGDTEIDLLNDNAGTAGNQGIGVNDPSENIYAEGMYGGEGGALETGGLTAFLGTGENSDNIFDLGEGDIAGNVCIIGGTGSDTVSLSSLDVTGNIKVRMGTGDDLLTIDDSEAVNLTVDDGSGDDVVLIDILGEGSIFSGQMIIKTAAGSDSIQDTADTRYTTTDKTKGVKILGVKGAGSTLNDANLLLGAWTVKPVIVL